MKFNKVFCVIDPTTTQQLALTQSVAAAKGSGAELRLYVCVAPVSGSVAEDRKAYQDAEIARYEAWLEKMAEEHRQAGITVSTEVESSDDWRKTLATAANRWDADLIIKASHRRTAIQRRFLKTSDWELLRNAKCPVLLIKSPRDRPVSSVIAAVNINAKDKAHDALNDKVIEAARLISEGTGAELHAANAYWGSLNFVHPPDLAKRVGTDRRFAHVGEKAPETLLGQVAEELDNPLVVVGSLARKGMQGMVVGNTAERILDSVNADVLVLIQSS